MAIKKHAAPAAKALARKPSSSSSPAPAPSSSSPPVAKKFASTTAYDAADQANRRRQPAINFRSEDDVLNPTRRAKVQANARDLARNFSIASWAIRRHLDYVTTFELHAKSKDRGFNREFEDWFYRIARSFQFDAAGRQSWDNAIRMLESQTVLTGDNGLIMLADGTFQGIEGDRVRDITDAPKRSGRWVQGIKVNDAGKHLAYCVGRRVGNGFTFERVIPAGNMVWHGCYDRWDQIRGISPIVAALNPLRDVYENFDYALAKAKVEQLFALVLTRKALDSIGDVTNPTEDALAPDEVKRSEYEVNVGKGPVLLDMDPGDDAKFLESSHPSTQFQDFTQLVTAVALKALDIPYSFFDEAHTNFFGSRGSWLHYERACRTKRNLLAAHQDRMLIRRLQIALLAGEFALPSGQTIDSINWEFVPLGMPWWRPSDEINGDVQAIAAGLNNPERICRSRGTGDPYENIDATADVLAYAKERGVPLSLMPVAYQEVVINGKDNPE
jgi:capsid protein